MPNESKPAPSRFAPCEALVEPPEYHAAAAHENSVRAQACLGFPEYICGFEVKPLNPWHVRWLAFTKSPFLINHITWQKLCGVPGQSEPKPYLVDDILNFFWICSPGFKPGSITSVSRLKKRFFPTARDRFNRKYSSLLNLKIDELVRGILEHIEKSYLDEEPPLPSGNDKSYFTSEIAIACELHEAYGYPVNIWDKPGRLHQFLIWSGLRLPPATHVPLKIIFQLRKCRALSQGGKASNKSETILSDELARINALKKN